MANTFSISFGLILNNTFGINSATISINNVEIIVWIKRTIYSDDKELGRRLVIIGSIKLAVAIP